MSLPLNGLPGWAKNVALGVVLIVGAVGLFVTRLEFTVLREDMREIRDDVRNILWRVGGPTPTQQQISNSPEAAIIDEAWATALHIAKMDKTPPPRPEVVIEFVPRFYPHPYVPGTFARLCGQSLGYFVPDGQGGVQRQVRIDIYIHEGETAVLRDGLVHEFLHYLLGIGVGRLAPEELVYEVWPAVCPPH